MNQLHNLTIIMIIGLILPTGFFLLLNNMAPGMSPEDIALDYIWKAPTFRFDGIYSTLRIVDSVDLKSNPVQHIITLAFTCRHSGYGNRTGKPTLQVLTHHNASVTVIEGKIVEALLDNRWDEVNQRYIKVVDADIKVIAQFWLQNAPTFSFDGVPESIKVIETWQAQTFAVPSFWQVTIEFDSRHPGYGDRKGQVLVQVITHHVIRIQVTEGEVTHAIIDNMWDELKQEMLPNAFTIEKAQSVAMSFLLGCATFKFDGIKDSVQIVRIDTLRMPNSYVVIIDFICAYPGYGDRTGHVTYGPSQKHEIKITVVNNYVTRAIIDEVWDELLQQKIK